MRKEGKGRKEDRGIKDQIKIQLKEEERRVLGGSNAYNIIKYIAETIVE